MDETQTGWDSPPGSNLADSKKVLGFDVECSAVIGTSFTDHDTLSFMVLEIPAAKPKLRTV